MNQILQGDARTILSTLPADLVDCCITSPPYWGLRDYGNPPIDWPECEYAPMPGLPAVCVPAISCQYGLEPDLHAFVAHTVLIFRELRRVLKPTGTLWLNMGDCYCSGDRGGYHRERPGVKLNMGHAGNFNDFTGAPNRRPQPGLKDKDLTGQPWRLAFALQADGWYLRSDVVEKVELYCPCGCGHVLEERIWRYSQDRDIIWHKPNPMPESCTDRPTKSPRYYYDADAVREEATTTRPDLLEFGPRPDKDGTGHMNDRRRAKNLRNSQSPRVHGNLPGRSDGGAACNKPGQTHRNKRTVWTIATQPYAEAHFATFPERLVEPCILAGTSEHGNCSECGKPWVRVVEKERAPRGEMGGKGNGREVAGLCTAARMGHGAGWRNESPATSTTLGWRPTCSCDAPITRPIVLDPFMGSGTVALVALKLNRNYLLIETKPEYIAMTERRLAEKMGLFA